MMWLLAQIGKLLVLILSIVLSFEYIITTQPDLKLQYIIIFVVGFIDKALIDMFSVLAEKTTTDKEEDDL